MAQSTYSDATSKPSRGRGRAIVVGLILIIVAVLAVVTGRGGLGALTGREGAPAGFVGGTVTVRAVVGSEKSPFFADPEVRDRLARLGYSVKVDTAGSRRIATGINLDAYDLAFPSSAPAAHKISEEADPLGSYTAFHSPMAIATFTPILEVLEHQGAAASVGGTWRLEMGELARLGLDGTRWRDIAGDAFPSPRTVQVATTDIRTSNSAAMYLALMSWILNDRQVVSTPEQSAAVIDRVTPLFLGQGYTESSSAGPFGDYLSQGIGSKPMVMVYEAQFLGEQIAEDSRISADMVLAYPSRTILSAHTAVGLSEAGAEVARLLAEDDELQALAARHGYRPNDPRHLTELVERFPADQFSPPELIDSVDPPGYDRLEELILGVSAAYGTPPPAEGTHED